VDDACTWNSKSRPDAAGNWAPTCIGVGKDDSGITYLSVFPNAPTSIALLDFDIEIEGDVSGECWLRNGQYSQNNGCTVRSPLGSRTRLKMVTNTANRSVSRTVARRRLFSRSGHLSGAQWRSQRG